MIFIHTKFYFHINESTIPSCPCPFQNFKYNKRSTLHNVKFIFPYCKTVQFKASRNNLLLGPLRIVISIIFKECFL